jgi:hypothetical protein
MRVGSAALGCNQAGDVRVSLLIHQNARAVWIVSKIQRSMFKSMFKTSKMFHSASLPAQGRRAACLAKFRACGYFLGKVPALEQRRYLRDGSSRRSHSISPFPCTLASLQTQPSPSTSPSVFSACSTLVTTVLSGSFSNSCIANQLLGSRHASSMAGNPFNLLDSAFVLANCRVNTRVRM